VGKIHPFRIGLTRAQRGKEDMEIGLQKCSSIDQTLYLDAIIVMLRLLILLGILVGYFSILGEDPNINGIWTILVVFTAFLIIASFSQTKKRKTKIILFPCSR